MYNCLNLHAGVPNTNAFNRIKNEIFHSYVSIIPNQGPRMLCFRSLKLSRCTRLRLSAALNSTSSKRPAPSLSEKERIVKESQKLYEESPTTAKVVSFWAAASKLKVCFLLLFQASIIEILIGGGY